MGRHLGVLSAVFEEEAPGEERSLGQLEEGHGD